MILEQSKDPHASRYNQSTSSWEVGESTKYRWVDNDRSPKSPWFYDMQEALDWKKAND